MNNAVSGQNQPSYPVDPKASPKIQAAPFEVKNLCERFELPDNLRELFQKAMPELEKVGKVVLLVSKEAAEALKKTNLKVKMRVE